MVSENHPSTNSKKIQQQSGNMVYIKIYAEGRNFQEIGERKQSKDILIETASFSVLL